jgi:hypothetical protein
VQFSQISALFEKVLPLALFGGLFVDWLRLRLAHRTEERKHIARAISSLLEFRFIVLGLHELPKHLRKLIPKELQGQISDDDLRMVDFTPFLPIDEELPKRYRTAVPSSFLPFLPPKRFLELI